MYELNLPKLINPLRLGQQKDTLCGFFLTQEMSRLLLIVDSVANKANAELHFTLDELNRPLAQGMIQTDVELTCQRCMKPFIFHVDEKINWAFVRSDDEAKRIHQNYEPILLEEEKVNLFLQIEDEILLNLPMIAVHSNLSECQPVDNKKDKIVKIAKASPFAELANFKVKK